ncbi:probable protein phosphatase 2C 5 isoform X2 [Physcomitrium patens]|nr:probable protein phosphatase 2C 5 isoform X2 [Physcomitrium patens]XP_024388383.1 probable protein phosphatase 2C 5 isoform X2 [Physcomitrium patens]|eukprot:XP_024388376.1 probable protein phosphatase 2C 5 isoform X2 [Physcomitrella patens]
MGVHPNGISSVRDTYPLSSLSFEELQPDVKDIPVLSHGQFMQHKKEEDFAIAVTHCERVPGDPSTTYAAFMVFDGHNGAAAATYSKQNLLNNVMSCTPPNLTREEWLAFLPRAMVAGFVKTDKDWQKLGKTSGTTATLVIVDGWTITVACVGDSRCVLDAQGVATPLTIDHRFDDNIEEQERIRASGGEIGRIKISNGEIEVGPLRVWPGGLCLSRSIGDIDVGDYIVAVPHVKQIKLSPAGGRLIIASDGVWDAVSTKKAARCCRGVSQPEIAAKYVVKEAIKARGLRDDTTCLVVDIAPRNSEVPFAPAVKKQTNFQKLLRCISVKEAHIDYDLNIMEEIFDENSPALAERLGPDASVHAGNGLFLCANCHCTLESDAGISVHAGNFFSQIAGNAWEGPFMCSDCKTKQDAAEKDAKQDTNQGSAPQQQGETGLSPPLTS